MKWGILFGWFTGFSALTFNWNGLVGGSASGSHIATYCVYISIHKNICSDYQLCVAILIALMLGVENEKPSKLNWESVITDRCTHVL